MRLVVQRVVRAKVSVNQRVVGQINQGYVVLVGIKKGDTQKQADYLAKKLINLRVMGDENDKMNRSILDIRGEILAISQFTLYGNTKKGNRPSFIKAAPPEEAEKLFNYFVEKLKESRLRIETGEFGAMMEVELVNSGPVTIILES